MRADRKTALLGAFEGNQRGQLAGIKNQDNTCFALPACPATRSVPSKAASSGSLGAGARSAPPELTRRVCVSGGRVSDRSELRGATPG